MVRWMDEHMNAGTHTRSLVQLSRQGVAWGGGGCSSTDSSAMGRQRIQYSNAKLLVASPQRSQQCFGASITRSACCLHTLLYSGNLQVFLYLERRPLTMLCRKQCSKIFGTSSSDTCLDPAVNS